MTVELDIINSALVKVAETPVSSLQSTSPPAVAALRQYPLQRRALLREYRWNFAKRRLALAADPVPPAFGFGKRFALPNDLLALIGVFSAHERARNYTTARDDFQVEGKWLLIDQEAVQIFYIRDVTDPGEFDPLFVEALAWRLAADIAFATSTGPQMASTAARNAEFAVRKARTANAIEELPEVVEASEWVDAHHHSGHHHFAPRIGPVS